MSLQIDSSAMVGSVSAILGSPKVVQVLQQNLEKAAAEYLSSVIQNNSPGSEERLLRFRLIPARDEKDGSLACEIINYADRPFSTMEIRVATARVVISGRPKFHRVKANFCKIVRLRH